LTTLSDNEYIATIEREQFKVQVVDAAHVTVNGQEYAFDFVENVPGEFSLLLDGRSFRVSVGLQKNNSSLSFQQSLYITLNNEQYVIDVDDKRSLLLKSLTTESSTKSDTTVLQSPMPGLVVKVEVQEGEEVSAGQGLIVLEAMKMENELKATENGKVTGIHVSAGKTVEKGEHLLTISHQ
jgi:pyruvate carboxylase subunit B